MTKEIQLNKGYVAIVDNGDYVNVSKFKWHILFGKSNKYAVTNYWSYGKNHLIYMHRWIMKATPAEIIDHKDNNGLNNTRDNLRKVTRSQNQHNRKLIGGITWDKTKQKYLVRINLNKKSYFIGRYCTIEEAKAARDAARKFLVAE